MNQSKQLKELIVSNEPLIMPDAYDPISARLIEKSGFKAVQCSGYSYSIAAAKNNEIGYFKGCQCRYNSEYS